MAPERAVVPFDGVIVQHDEIAVRSSISAQHFLVVLIDEGLHDPIEGKQMHQARGPGHDEMDAGRFERLEESARQAQRHHVLVPGLERRPARNLITRGWDQRPALPSR